MKRILFSIVCISLASTCFADPNVSYANAQLTRVAKDGNAQTVKASPSDGVNVNARDKGGSVALGTASMEGYTKVVRFQTSLGDIVVELDADAAPVTTKNFLRYVQEEFYDGTIFHRVIPNFMIQGGGFTPDIAQKKTHEPIKNEASNGLQNNRGTIAMARTNNPDSATAQFFINLKNNDFLNYGGPSKPGYAVFGKVVEGMEIVDKIAATPTTRKDMMADVPIVPIVIKSVKVDAVASNENTQSVQPARKDSEDKNAQLLQAAKDGNLQSAQTALGNGADINTKNKDGFTAMSISAEKGHAKIVKLLLEKGADVNVRDKYGTTALSMASQANHTEIVVLLLQNGASVNVKDTVNGLSPLWVASQNGHAQVVKLLLEKGADVNVKRTGAGTTALWMAAQEGRTEVVKLLLEKGADIEVKDNTNGITALWKAAQNGYAEICTLLLEKNADINTKDPDGATALSIAVQNGHTDVVKVLLGKNADVNAKDKVHGMTPIYMAVQSGSEEIIRLLLDKGADVNVRITDTGTSPLMIAAYKGRTEVVKLLLEKGADVNAKEKSGGTALDAAKEGGHTDIVQLLKKAGAKE